MDASVRDFASEAASDKAREEESAREQQRKAEETIKRDIANAEAETDAERQKFDDKEASRLPHVDLAVVMPDPVADAHQVREGAEALNAWAARSEAAEEGNAETFLAEIEGVASN